VYVKLLATGGVVAFSYGWLNALSVPLFGVPLTVVAMAAAGTFLSASQGVPEKKGVKFYLKHSGYMFMAIVSVSIIPNIMGWDWAVPRLEGPIAGGLAFSARHWVPATVELIPEIIKKIFKVKEYKE
jgi:hypothetical protein